ncbi:MAG: SMC-Scp complex subunit ScpB [Verrucomicrobia bacterium]|nr:SMC-Scp complex subunit ScpB [Verrucomicrobiota bacterium]
MAFNLKKVLKALLFSSSQPLAIKDIQAAFTRFHEQAAASAAAEAAAEDSASKPAGDNAAPAPAPAAEPAGEATEVFAEPVDAELYQEVPSLITATQVREVMDEISAELKANDDGLLLIEGSSGYRLVTHPRVARWVRILRQEPPPLKLSASSIETLAIVAYRQPVTRGEIETIRGVSAEAGINKLLERDLIFVVGRADLPGRPIQYGTTDHFLEFVGIKSIDELPASDVLSSRQIDSWLKNAMSPAQAPSDTDMGLANEQIPLETPVATAEAPAAETSAPATATAGAEPGPAPESTTTDESTKPTS